MSTNALVVEKRKNGSYRRIYVHWDGYLEGVGAILRNVFNTDAKVKGLIDLGDCSSIVGATDIDNEVVAYHRDLNEDWDRVKPEITQTFEPVYGFFFVYLWEDGKWTAYRGGDQLDWEE